MKTAKELNDKRVFASDATSIFLRKGGRIKPGLVLNVTMWFENSDDAVGTYQGFTLTVGAGFNVSYLGGYSKRGTASIDLNEAATKIATNMIASNTPYGPTGATMTDGTRPNPKGAVFRNLGKSDWVIEARTGQAAAAPQRIAGAAMRWVTEAVDGAPGYVRIRNASNGADFLHIESGHVALGPIQPGWHSAMWTIALLSG